MFPFPDLFSQALQHNVLELQQAFKEDKISIMVAQNKETGELRVLLCTAEKVGHAISFTPIAELIDVPPQEKYLAPDEIVALKTLKEESWTDWLKAAPIGVLLVERAQLLKTPTQDLTQLSELSEEIERRQVSNKD